MQVKFWGTRGSLPYTMMTRDWVNHFSALMNEFFDQGFQSKEDIASYIKKSGDLHIGDLGSATTCVQITSQSQNLIIDVGSGIKNYGDFLKQHSDLKQHHILMTHFHYDHIIGAPFFFPNFDENHQVHYYFVQNDGEEMIKKIFSKPLFPVPFSDLKAKIFFHKLSPYLKNQVLHFEVVPYMTDHPDPCYGFKISDGKFSYSHAVDNECSRTTLENLGQDAGLYQKTDLLYIDTQFNKESYQVGWGHGTIEKALQLCKEFDVPRVVFGHHDLSTRSLDLNKIEKEILASEKINWQWGYDGLSIQLGDH